jgi:hypothetical protein
MARRLPRPISVLLTIISIAGSLCMSSKRCIDCADALVSPTGRKEILGICPVPSSGALRSRILAEELPQLGIELWVF